MFDDYTGWEDEAAAERLARHKEKQALHEERLRGVVRKLARDPDGQYFLRWLVRGTGVFEVRVPASLADASYDAGQRTVGLSVLTLCASVGAGDILVNDKEVQNG